MSETIICGLTSQQVEKLKAEHGALFVATVKDGEKLHQAVCREPDTKILSATNAMSKTDDMKAAMVLFDNCVIACDEEIKKRDLLKLQVTKAIGDRMTALTVTVKNL